MKALALELATLHLIDREKVVFFNNKVIISFSWGMVTIQIKSKNKLLNRESFTVVSDPDPLVCVRDLGEKKDR